MIEFSDFHLRWGTRKKATTLQMEKTGSEMVEEGDPGIQILNFVMEKRIQEMTPRSKNISNIPRSMVFSVPNISI